MLDEGFELLLESTADKLGEILVQLKALAIVEEFSLGNLVVQELENDDVFLGREEKSVQTNLLVVCYVGLPVSLSHEDQRLGKVPESATQQRLVVQVLGVVKTVGLLLELPVLGEKVELLVASRVEHLPHDEDVDVAEELVLSVQLKVFEFLEEKLLVLLEVL